MTKKNVSPVAPTPGSVGFAWALANSYANLGFAEYDALSDAFEVADRMQVEPEFFDAVSRAVPVAMLMAFAAELYLKTIALQHGSRFVQEHNLKELFRDIPADHQAAIQRGFEAEMLKNPRTLSLRFGPKKIDGNVGATALSFDTALSKVSNFFVDMRYAYESFAAGREFWIEFRWLLYLVIALQDEVKNYKESALDAE